MILRLRPFLTILLALLMVALSMLAPLIAKPALATHSSAQLISHRVGNAVPGKGPLDGLDKLGRNFLVTESMGIVQNGIGDLGVGRGRKWEGSLPHLLLHGGVSCVAMAAMDGTCSAGFFAGASQGVLSGSGLSDADKANLTPLVGAMAGFLAGDGSAINVSFAGTIAESGLRNNYLNHKQRDEFKKNGTLRERSGMPKKRS